MHAKDAGVDVGGCGCMRHVKSSLCVFEVSGNKVINFRKIEQVATEVRCKYLSMFHSFDYSRILNPLSSSNVFKICG